MIKQLWFFKVYRVSATRNNSQLLAVGDVLPHLFNLRPTISAIFVTPDNRCTGFDASESKIFGVRSCDATSAMVLFAHVALQDLIII